MPNNKIIAVVNLKAKLRPMDRGVIEDAFLDFFESLNIETDITGGGTLVEENGEMIECDIEIDLTYYNEKILQRIIKFFESTLAPKGSSITVEDNDGKVLDKVYFGDHEGLALYMNNTDLPDHYYEDYDINYVYNECNRRIKGVGNVYSYWNGNEETAIYMYGDCYEKMLKLIEPFLNAYPLCEKVRIVQTA